MGSKETCLCGISEYIVLSCSGACDLGQITDMVARRLRDNGVRKMNCLAAVGAGLDDYIENFRKSNLLMLDGCNSCCGKNTLLKNNINNFIHFKLTDLRLEKYKTPINDDIIKKVYDEVEIIY